MRCVPLARYHKFFAIAMLMMVLGLAVTIEKHTCPWDSTTVLAILRGLPVAPGTRVLITGLQYAEHLVFQVYFL